MIDNTNFYVVFYWMINELGLKGAELPIFAIIYSFSQDGQTKFTGSLNYLAEFSGMTKQGVIKTLKKLIDKDLIVKYQTIENDVRYNSYQANLKVVNRVERGSKLSLMGWSTEFNGGSKLSLPNNKEYNKYNNKEIDYSAIADTFNSICISLPKVKMLTDTRKTHLNTFVDILKKYDLSAEEYFKRVQKSDFLSGRNGQWSNCSFDWLIKRENTLKVCENNYKNKTVNKPQSYCEY